MATPRARSAQLQRDRHECLSETAQTYLRDVHDHCVQIIDLVETYREIASGLAETYVSVVSNRTNEVMKVLTVIGTIFIPLTFLAGVYGMNMPIPENAWPHDLPGLLGRLRARRGWHAALVPPPRLALTVAAWRQGRRRTHWGPARSAGRRPAQMSAVVALSQVDVNQSARGSPGPHAATLSEPGQGQVRAGSASPDVH